MPRALRGECTSEDPWNSGACYRRLWMEQGGLEGVPSYQIGTDGILRITFAQGDTFGIEAARVAVDRHLEIAAGRKLLTLVDVSNLRSMDREARDLVSGPAVESVTTRLAIVVGGPVSAVIGNFFLKVTRPLYPTRLFSDRAAAAAWLLGTHSPSDGAEGNP